MRLELACCLLGLWDTASGFLRAVLSKQIVTLAVLPAVFRLCLLCTQLANLSAVKRDYRSAASSTNRILHGKMFWYSSPAPHQIQGISQISQMPDTLIMRVVRAWLCCSYRFCQHQILCRRRPGWSSRIRCWRRRRRCQWLPSTRGGPPRRRARPSWTTLSHSSTAPTRASAGAVQAPTPRMGLCSRGF